MTTLAAATEMSRKHGDMRIAALRQIYGAAFGTGVDGRSSLKEAIGSLDAPSLETLVRDYESGWLFGPETTSED